MSIIGQHPYLFCAHIINIRLLLYHLLLADFDKSQYIINKEIKQIDIDL